MVYLFSNTKWFKFSNWSSSSWKSRSDAEILLVFLAFGDDKQLLGNTVYRRIIRPHGMASLVQLNCTAILQPSLYLVIQTRSSTFIFSNKISTIIFRSIILIIVSSFSFYFCNNLFFRNVFWCYGKFHFSQESESACRVKVFMKTGNVWAWNIAMGGRYHNLKKSVIKKYVVNHLIECVR